MIHLFSRRWVVALFVLGFLMAASGLKSGAAQVIPTPTPTQETDVAQGTPLAVEVTFGSGSFNLPVTTTGLSDLSSYRATLNLSFRGTKAGQPSQWSRTYVMLTSQKPAVRQLTIDTTGDTTSVATSAATSSPTGNSPSQVFMAEVNGTLFERQGQAACTASVIEKGNSLAETSEPAGFLSGVIGANVAGSETVNDVAANHYTFDEQALGQQGVAQSKGELWVAADGGYIVKYILATTGNADYFGDGAEGIVTWDYELSDINKPFTVKLPEDCPSALVDAPLLPDATNVQSVSGLLSYNTPSNLSNVVAFYQQQLPPLGWQASYSSPTTETGALLEFTRSGQQLLVMVGVDGTTTTVNLLLVSAPQGPITPTKSPTRTPIPTRTSIPTRTKLPTRTPTNTKTPKPTRTPTP